MNNRDLIAVMEVGILEHFLEMLLVVDRSANQLARICHRAEQRHPGERQGRRLARDRLDRRPERLEMRDQDVEGWQRMAVARQAVERRRHVPQLAAVDNAKATVPKSAKPHRICASRAAPLYITGGDDGYQPLADVR